MTLSRQQQKDLNRLRSQAEDLWEDQREVLEQAAKVVREAGHQAGRFASEDVAPRVRDAFEGGRRVARNAGDRLQKDVVPAVTGAIGSAWASIEKAKNRELRDALKAAGRAGNDVGVRLGLVKHKPSPGPGAYILIGLGIVALAGIAYAAWQTLRADDDLWVDDEPLVGQDIDDDLAQDFNQSEA